ncbi:two-component system response regulator CreB [Amylibacter kogurei]|uniref:Two-component system response regulator CreB n=1 Tax=Paramylibacter kogurei TaxID=1889778 RepID=A0A2G5KAR6_9RHOB|nr:response regulator transcription factor [Amylibacter kogurei]PIB26152.1 two-component system response regulator CreB [Amylibacter kogurei]
MKTVLIVDDDVHIRDVLKFALGDAGFSVVEAANGNQALGVVKRAVPELIILDIGMPEMDGLEMCRELRKTSQVPILFLTARNDEIDRILAFELGGDDYLSKPFSPRELVLRVKAILKRGSEPIAQTVSTGDLVVEQETHRATLNGKSLELTAREFSLLNPLAQNPGRIFTKGQLMAHIYGENIYVENRTLDSHVRNLRAKARALGCDDLVVTAHGIGFRLGDCVCQ